MFLAAGGGRVCVGGMVTGIGSGGGWLAGLVVVLVMIVWLTGWCDGGGRCQKWCWWLVEVVLMVEWIVSDGVGESESSTPLSMVEVLL